MALQVFSSKPVASDENAVFVVQVIMFETLFWNWMDVIFCPAIRGD